MPANSPANPTPSLRLHGLDTLRALAILAVIVFHLQGFLPAILAPVASAGWMGVDLFFVLSGFLLGTQLLAPLVHGRRVRLAGFWLSRAFRILPAYLAVLGLYLAVPLWREQPSLPAAWKFLSFTQNLLMIYPAQLAFSHAWSLCVEEHFYLLLPVFVLVLARRPALWKTASVLAALFVGGVLLRAWILFRIVRAPGLDPNLDPVLDPDRSWVLFMKFIYYPTYCRLDGLLAGVALACIRTLRPDWWAQIGQRGNSLALAGVALAGAATLTFRGGYPNFSETAGILLGFPALALGFTLLAAAALAGNGPLRRKVPAARPLATLAFSLYLTHKSVAHLDRILFPSLQDPTWQAAAVYAVTCLGAAALLYACVERPFLLLRDRLLAAPHPARSGVEARLDPAL